MAPKFQSRSVTRKLQKEKSQKRRKKFVLKSEKEKPNLTEKIKQILEKMWQTKSCLSQILT